MVEQSLNFEKSISVFVQLKGINGFAWKASHKVTNKHKF